ncbi:MAG: FecR domain-containing protein [Elusimicrobiota bacterium]
MKILALGLIAATLWALPVRAQAPDAAASDDRWDTRVSAAKGDVVVHPADGGEEASAEADMPLDEGDRVTTGPDSYADISLDGDSLIHVGANSDFTVEKTAKNESSFSLALGSLMAKIQKLGSQRLLVRTPSAVAAVRGTEFGVEAESDQQTHVGVFDEGRVEVKGDAGTETLAPNQETSVARGRAPMKPILLKRFARMRGFMKGHRQRLAALRKRWKSLPPAQRRARRQQVMRRMRRLRREMRQNRQQMNKNQQRRQAIEERRRRNK